MPALLTRTLVILLVLRAVAAPVALHPSTASPSPHQSFVIRMRCWPFQRLQRFSASSGLLQGCSGKNRLLSGEGSRLLNFWPPRPAPDPYLAVPIPRAPGDVATNRLAVCLRC